ncbi:putative protein OS=Tsukamurella paurometabola (strain ATCC 8368 / DSM / CCUG 35730 /CIP 100753 / JCM 10117 / KCTC 9821 / NBRC 16120 / NCIMB 702349/ NCTC 13040) OX=521096 GN=Tpau_3491 PE=4 SV=1 [Tsukamurella paurometabola]|uniref:Uncharacterized protein n=1 Tax=Tsukamurella paurometabola (strain ATCC 8368 / DSM 20162 / CCUG 35730 / CIP 100753 / JCM 10117 / KCTC 9821 / NBRC 16120 / NCIMB 702349 / NCTC 13040) TaxID=521096 RepID=D5UX51_TSUPD|nr:hypothetical protein [Tsukamurella paurometabola]ADG80070.1 hypothetical protein Tpau_3491 [Tsukamurella paurometabola DSM 20162]SUP38303.1 Uncharacterised protein [Tsukamurella paurometabola]
MTENTIRRAGADGAVSPHAMPRALRWARWLLIAVSIGHAAAIVAVIALRESIRADIVLAHPEYTATEASRMVLLELIRTGSFHLLLVVVCAIYAIKLPAGRPRVVRIIIISQVLSLIFGGFTIATAPSALIPVQVPFVIAAVVILILFARPESRAYLAERRAVERASSA